MRRIILMAALMAWGLFAFSCGEAEPLTGGDKDYDALLSMIGDARIVMLGESTHGSREFYRERARITRRLIEEAGFGAVILEAPWESVRRLDAYIRGSSGDSDAASALGGFIRFPRWTWRNSEVRDFAESLRTINFTRAPGLAPVRLYGMDLYSVPESADAVVTHLARRSIEAATLARQRYACFAGYLAEPMLYGRDVESGLAASCAEGAAVQLAEMPAEPREEDDFAAWQSARVVSNGEAYYRAIYHEGELSWNLREQHLADTLIQVLKRMGETGKIVVWAHNSHQGDARESDQGAVGELSLGQLMRERYSKDAVLVGFSTYRGRVRAAAKWGGKDRVWRLRPALRYSWHERLHRLGQPRLMLIFRSNPALAKKFAERRLERVVGVNYLPKDELSSHYRYAHLSQQFDAIIHIDETSAVDSLP
ncbi:MAG: erythromycin esterase family protein [Gallionella sp.]|jgi:erythromycin esterase-like protein